MHVQTSYGTLDGLPFGDITDVDFDTNGDAWLGTGLGGISIFDGTPFTEITETEHLINDRIRAIVMDTNGNKWVGTADGVSVFNPSNLFVENHTIMLVLPAPDTLNPVEDVKIAGNGNIWVGIYVDYLVTEGGVAMFDGNSWTDYDVSDGLVGPVVRAIDIDSQDNIWVTTSTGISKIADLPVNPNDYWSSWDNNAAFPEDTVTSTGLTERQINSNIAIYPNPTTSKVNIATKQRNTPYNVAIERIEIITVQGDVVKSISIDSQPSSAISIESPVAGIYFERIYTRGNVETARFIKQ
ncbi:MAG: T9SS type A sorting domain-containing protein [Flavobacteriales bacterium]|nr:T9SS type A sorting domain-containing protein [Flavobacteriales bacterium]